MSRGPRLKPSFRPVRHGGGTVQLGLTPESGGVLLAGLDAPEIGLLERLDGSHTESDLYALAAGWGVPRRRATALLDLLRERGLIVDRVGPEQGRADRPRADDPHVVLAGSGPLADTLASVVRAGGGARVSTGTWATELAEAELRAALTPWPTAPRPGPQLVVSVAGPGALDVRAGQAWRELGVPVLPVAASTGRVVIGPLVRPSAVAEPDDACLACVALTRSDGEAGWPASTAPALAPERDGREAALAVVAAGAVAMLIDAVLGGEPVPAGVSLETRLPWPRFDHRRWPRHPACPAHTESVHASSGLG